MIDQNDRTIIPPVLSDALRDGESETGLPWLHTWRSVYLLVQGLFVLWVMLLFALGVIFS